MSGQIVPEMFCTFSVLFSRSARLSPRGSPGSLAWGRERESPRSRDVVSQAWLVGIGFDIAGRVGVFPPECIGIESCDT